MSGRTASEGIRTTSDSDGQDRPAAQPTEQASSGTGPSQTIGTVQESWAHIAGHRIYVRDYPGSEPAVVLMHGFPDNMHLYDRLLPHLAQHRRVITFDFLGWGRSDKPAGYPYTATNQIAEVEAVLDRLGLDRVVLVAHDSSGPPAIDWALAHPKRVAELVLLNTYYGWHPALRPPEAIILFATPLLRTLGRAVTGRFDAVDRWLYNWQVGRFFRDAAVRDEVLPLLYADFRPARPAFWRLNADLYGATLVRLLRSRRLGSFDRPIKIIFGDADPYLNRRVARRFHRLFPDSTLNLLPGARHYVQIDEPAEVARLILAPGDESGGVVR